MTKECPVAVEAVNRYEKQEEDNDSEKVLEKSRSAVILTLWSFHSFCYFANKNPEKTVEERRRWLKVPTYFLILIPEFFKLSPTRLEGALRSLRSSAGAWCVPSMARRVYDQHVLLFELTIIVNCKVP